MCMAQFLFFFPYLKKEKEKKNYHILVNKYKFQQDGHPSDNNGINTSNTNTAKHLPSRAPPLRLS